MSIRNYQFYCDHCGYKRLTDGTDIKDLREVKTSPIPRGVPVLDPLAQKSTTPTFGAPAEERTAIKSQPNLKRPKRFKCPKCGYVIQARQIKVMEQNEQQASNPNGSQSSPAGPPLPGEFA